MKISFYYFSTFSEPGFKSKELKQISRSLKDNSVDAKFYCIGRKRRVFKNIVEYFLPFYIVKIAEKICKFINIDTSIAYFIGEIAYGLNTIFDLIRDDSDIFIIKSRPYIIASILKFRKKNFWVELLECHPFFSYNQYIKASKYVGFNNLHIYSFKKAIIDASKTLEIAEKVLVPSIYSKKTCIANGISREKLELLQLSIPYSTKKTIFDEKESFNFISVASHSLIKGTNILIDCFMNNNFANSNLIIAGPMANDIKKIYQSRPLKKNILLPGTINPHDYLSKPNTIGILISNAEGFPRSVAEYISYGCPVIVTNAATCDFIKNDVNGYVINFLNENDLKLAINKYIKNKYIFEKQRKNNLKLLKNYYLEKLNYADNFMKILNKNF